MKNYIVTGIKKRIGKNSRSNNGKISRRNNGKSGAGVRCLVVSLILIFVLTGCGGREDEISLNEERNPDGDQIQGETIDQDGDIIHAEWRKIRGTQQSSDIKAESETSESHESNDNNTGYPIFTWLPEDFFVNSVMESEGIYCIGGSERLQDSYFGFIAEDGREIAPFIYQEASPFTEGLACVCLDGKFGFIDKNGETAIPFVFDYATPFSEGLAYFSTGDTYGFMDKSGEQVLALDCDLVSSFHEGLAWFCIDGKYGYMDKTGAVVVPPIYDDADHFREGYAKIRLGGKFGVINKQGQEVVPVVYQYISFDEGVFIARNEDMAHCFAPEENGEVRLVLEASSIYVEHVTGRKLLHFTREEKAGLADYDGTILIEPEYDILDPLEDRNLAVVWKRDGEELYCGLIDFQGNEMVPYGEYTSIASYIGDSENSLIKVVKVDESGEGRKSGYLNLEDFTLQIPVVYDTASSFQNGLAVVSQNGRYGLIDTDGNVVCPIEYKNIRMYENGAIALWQEQSAGGSDITYLYNAQGELLFQSREVEYIHLSGDCYEIELQKNRTQYLSLDGRRKTALDGNPSTIYSAQLNISVASSRQNKETQYVIIRTGDLVTDVEDIQGAVLKSAVTPRIDLYYQAFLEKAQNPTFGYTGVRQLYRLYLVDGYEQPVLYYYTEPYKYLNFPESDSTIYQIRDGEATVILSGNECGGSARGDYAILWYESKTGRVLPGLYGTWGGFGGFAYGGSVYDRKGEGFEETASFYCTSQGYYADYPNVKESPELFYDNDDNPFSADRLPEDGDAVTEYEVNGERVKVERYQEVKDRYEGLYSVWF